MQNLLVTNLHTQLKKTIIRMLIIHAKSTKINLQLLIYAKAYIV